MAEGQQCMLVYYDLLKNWSLKEMDLRNKSSLCKNSDGKNRWCSCCSKNKPATMWNICRHAPWICCGRCLDGDHSQRTPSSLTEPWEKKQTSSQLPKVKGLLWIYLPRENADNPKIIWFTVASVIIQPHSKWTWLLFGPVEACEPSSALNLAASIDLNVCLESQAPASCTL